MYNKAILIGRLTADPELKQTPNGVSVCSFSIACDRAFSGRNGERQTDFINIVTWRQQAEFVSKYFTKGRMAVVSGRLQIRNWTDKEGNKRRSAEVVADNVYFGDSKRDAAGDNSGYSPAPSYGYSAPAAPAAGSSHGYAAPAAPAPASDFSMIEDDDSQLPF